MYILYTIYIYYYAIVRSTEFEIVKCDLYVNKVIKESKSLIKVKTHEIQYSYLRILNNAAIKQYIYTPLHTNIL